MEHPEPPTTDYAFLDDELARRGADAFVHVGDRFDDDVLYLTRFHGPDRAHAFVYADETATLCAPSLFAEQAEREFAGDRVLTPDDGEGETAAERAVEVLRAHGTDGPVAVLPDIARRHAIELEAAGYGLDSTDAVAAARERKTDAEVACLAAVEAAAHAGMARAESVLADAETRDDEVVWGDEPLTTERLRREINAAFAARGIRDAGNTVIGAGPSCADLHFTGTDDIGAGETVLIDLSPRGPTGYYGDLTRTFVVGEVGRWETDAYAAVEEAQDAALSALDGGAGTVAATAHEAAAEALRGAGFEVGDVDVGFYHSVGHGIGASLHEAPSLTADRELEAGNVVTVEPGVYDPARGGVRIEDVVVVTDGGYENLADYPRSIVPRSRDPDAVVPNRPP